MAEVVTYREAWRGEFERLNRAWIETWFVLEEADLAYSLGVIDMHARIKVRLPKTRRVKSEDDDNPPGQIIETTYGRIMFNMMLPEGMDFYNIPLKSGDLSNVISDCYQLLGRAATIKLLEADPAEAPADEGMPIASR